MSRLWYRQPANIWDEALPIGNGRLGAMLFGGVSTERIQTNEESIFYGTTTDRNNPDALKNLPKIRELIFSGQIKEAEELMVLALSGCPYGMHQYQSLGDITIYYKDVDEYSEYRRELDLDKAIHIVEFTSGKTRYRRETLISAVDDCMIMHLTAEGEGKINLNIHNSRVHYYDGVKKIGTDGICLYGNLGKGGFDFSQIITATSRDGAVRNIGERLLIEDATDACIYFCADSSYHVPSEKLEKSIIDRLEGAKSRDFNTVKSEHIADYKKYYDRVEFTLGDLSEYDAVPTDERILAAAEKPADIGLSKLYFDFGRYLLISCSRPGGLPATLQGIWNEHMDPPWDCKYTININLQMNYWPAEVCDLGDCHTPVFDLIKKMVPNGERTAKMMYGARGWMCHHNTDIHGDCAPQDLWVPGTYWVMGGAWMCTHIWTHYQYTRDEDFLREYFPIMRGAAEFFIDFLVEKDGYLVTCPSVSPENTFILENGQQGSNTYGVTMDNQILRDLFTQCIDAASILGVEDELNEQIKEMRSKLIPTKIGVRGNILEWPKDYKEAEPGHRHISHLYGLYPSNQINCVDTPELVEAAKKTLEYRLASGGGHTGWSRAWITNHYAKLWDGEAAYDNICKLFANSTYLNMFDKHPPFQIDGNFGVTAAIAHMLVQSDEDRIFIMPAMPEAWKKEGMIKGLRLVGGGSIDMTWRDGKLTSCTVVFVDKTTKTVFISGKQVKIEFEADKPERLV